MKGNEIAMDERDNNLMIDLETLGLSSDAVILSIGVVRFELKGKVVEPLFHKGINIQSCLSAGLKVDGSTIEWWLSQKSASIAAISNTIKSNQHSLLGTVLTELDDIVKNLNRKLWSVAGDTSYDVWSHGSNYDTVILSNAYRAIGGKAWWNYKNVRDTRTLFALADYKYEAKGGHDALDDAFNQAVAVQEAYQQLMRRVNNGSN